MLRKIAGNLRKMIVGAGSQLPTPPTDIAARAEAHSILKMAIKDLSQGSQLQQSAAVPQIMMWNSKDLKDLDKVELEHLAKAYFTGLDGSIIKSPEKAVSIWTEAIKKGSKESRYSRAICYRDGVGVQKDALYAFQELMAMAESENYHLAHVSHSIFRLHAIHVLIIIIYLLQLLI
jgi:TPR repeat protein